MSNRAANLPSSEAKDLKDFLADGDESEQDHAKLPVRAPETERLRLDSGEIRLKIRQHWWQIWRSPHEPPPPPARLDDALLIPLATCSIFAKLTYTWISDMMVLGYTRTLQATDLWKLDERRETAYLSGKLDESWARRVKAAEDWNSRLASGEISPGLLLRARWVAQAAMTRRETYSDRRAALEQSWRTDDGKRHASLAWALNDVFGLDFWLAGGFKVIGDTSALMGPLIIRQIINFGKEQATAKENGTTPPSIGRGFGMALGLFCLTVTASVCQHQFFWRSMTTGVLARAALIGSIYERGVHFTGKSRSQIPNSTLVNHISTDVSRIDAAAQWFHAGWTVPVQVSVCLAILLVQLGPSALAGFSLFILVMPLQERLMSMQFRIRRSSMKWTDMRAKVLLEVLGAMRIVKYFTYELPFQQRIFDIRKKELVAIRKIQFVRSSNIALALSIPALAATIAFLVYTLTAHNFNEAIIFSSLSLFQLLRQPLMLLPRALSAVTDSKNAFQRLNAVFHAQLKEGSAVHVDATQDLAVIVEDAAFEWEETPEEREAKLRQATSKKASKEAAAAALKAAPVVASPPNGKPFQVQDINMAVRPGTVTAIVGQVGSGKSSLLQGLIGDMRKLRGRVSFGGCVAYCAQSAWIQNATLRENILFGQPFEEDRYWNAVETASLLPDLDVLADGDLTEIGEKGINLSGGQKQRVNIARALYYNADIIIMDDPLSAVDAHVGEALFTNAIIGSRNQGKAVLLVTHALHFLSECDYIYTMDEGKIAEEGTYQDLISRGGAFARLDEAFGGADSDTDVDAEGAISAEEARSNNRLTAKTLDAVKTKAQVRSGAGTGKLEGRLIISEKRTTGSVSWSIYWEYLKAGHGAITGPLLILFMFLMQAATLLNTYVLVWWQANTFRKSISFYQILYACLAIAQAVFTFAVGVVMDHMSFYVSVNLHRSALRNIFHAPMAFFDTTPLGRILSVFGKDVDTIDDQLAVSMRMFVIMMSGLIGSVLIITIIEHYFIIAAVVIAFGYNYFAAFYRASALEMKRLDSLLRSLLYSHFSESLTGLPTIRSYGEIPRFLGENKYYIDLENRALFLTVTNQRWLAIRLDFMGGLMIFVVAMLAVNGVSGINPAQIGLVLVYTTTLTQTCGIVTRQSAEVENYMNSVERIVHYSNGSIIDQEAPDEITEHKPLPEWPSKGVIEFEDIRMRYRPGLPEVLKGITFTAEAGEKIGVVGRTGAGKSSLMLALFRIVELSAGSVKIDGVDISTIGLRDLRSKVAIIPQEPLLFSGTIRSNLDPFNLHDDARLWDSLRRSYLGARTQDAPEATEAEPQDPSSHSRFTLDHVVEAEGSNLSQGERSLLSIARALVKDSRVVILDEATASVDLATDSKIQRSIQTEFKDRTLLCIAHRLRTILSYSRILVLDAGEIAEFDTPERLFVKEGSIFRGMCDRSHITLEDIQRSKIVDAAL